MAPRAETPTEEHYKESLVHDPRPQEEMNSMVLEAMQRTGLGYAAGDVHEYLAAKVRGRPEGRPKPVRWRK